MKRNPPDSQTEYVAETLGSTRALSRRLVLSALGVTALLPFVPRQSRAQDSSAPAVPAAAPAVSQLPLKTTGLEHMGTVVPDVEAAGKFYGRLFNPELYKEKEPPLRYYVTLGVGYLALGSHATPPPRPYFDHFCALVQDYNGAAMAEELKSNGLPAGKYGIIPDPDAIGLQLLSVPGGLAKSTTPAGRIVEGDALVHPLGLSEVVLHVPDVDKSLQFYRKFFGQEVTRTHKPEAAWFQIVGTRLGIETAASGEEPRVDRIGVKVQPFDRKHVSRELTKLGAKLEKIPKHDSNAKNGLRFRDPLGLGIELIPT